MGHEVRGVPETPALTHPAGGSIGSYLARQRRLRGISLDELAESTKIPRRSLERLEAGAFDGEPDGFSRGFVRTISNALGLDSEDSIMRMSGEPPDADDGGADRLTWNAQWIAIGAAVLFGIGAITAAGWLWRSVPMVAEPTHPEIVFRRDAVRALALEQEQKQAQQQPQQQEDRPLSGELEAARGPAAGPATARK